MMEAEFSESNYTLVMWPESQPYMDEDWFEAEAVLENEGKFGSAAYFIPTKYIERVYSRDNILRIVTDYENWDGAGEVPDEDIAHWVRKYLG